MVDMTDTQQTPLEKAIASCGSEASLARACGYSQNAIWSAKRKGRVSAELAVAIERVTGVTRQELRPDLFGEAA